MKKYLFVLILLSVIVPSVASAAWWNPLSWNWKALFSDAPTTVESLPGVSPFVKNNQTNDLVKKPEVKEQSIAKEAPANTSTINLCHGVNYSECSYGKTFVCMADGGSCALNSDLKYIKTCGGQKYNTNCLNSEFVCNPSAGIIGCVEGGASKVASCNGKVYSVCPAGQSFVCPSGRGEPSCLQQSSASTQNPTQNQIPTPTPTPAQTTAINKMNSQECVAAQQALKDANNKAASVPSGFERTNLEQEAASLSIKMTSACGVNTYSGTINTSCYTIGNTINCTSQ